MESVFESEMFPDMPGINEDLCLCKGKEHTISVAYTYEQKEKAEKTFGADFYAMISDVLIGEGLAEVCKVITKAGFSPEEKTPISLRDLPEVFGNSGAKFAVCGIRLAAELGELEEYRYTKENSFSSTKARTYPVGNMHGVEIYVDPLLLWDDKRIFLCQNLFANFRIANKGTAIDERTLAPKSQAAVTIVTEDPLSTVYEVNDLLSPDLDQTL